MLDFMTLCLLSLVTISSLVILAVGSTHRLRKLQKPVKIVLPKSEIHHIPFWSHRAFQMRRLSHLEDFKPTITVIKETSV